MGAVKLNREYLYLSVSKRPEPKWHLDTDGYLSAYVTISEGSFNVRKHLLVFFISNGYLPEHVDHKDGNKVNNEPSNLRAATKPQNHHNSKKQSNNTSGAKGVYKIKDKWEVRVQCNKVKHRLGPFESFDLAVLAAEKLREKLHGSFARHN